MFCAWNYNVNEYWKLHQWIKNSFGKAIICLNRVEKVLEFECSNKSNNFEWSNKSGKYKKKLTDWQPLCISCHRIYDYWRIEPKRQKELNTWINQQKKKIQKYYKLKHIYDKTF